MIACLRICKFLFHLTDWTGLFQASLKAEDILNSWPDTEVGRVLREYGEESNWRLLQNKIVQARLQGGLHSTGELVDLIQNATTRTRGRFLLHLSIAVMFCTIVDIFVPTSEN